MLFHSRPKLNPLSDLNVPAAEDSQDKTPAGTPADTNNEDSSSSHSSASNTGDAATSTAASSAANTPSGAFNKPLEELTTPNLPSNLPPSLLEATEKLKQVCWHHENYIALVSQAPNLNIFSLDHFGPWNVYKLNLVLFFQAADRSVEGKCKFFTPSVNKMLLEWVYNDFRTPPFLSAQYSVVFYSMNLSSGLSIPYYPY